MLAKLPSTSSQTSSGMDPFRFVAKLANVFNSKRFPNSLGIVPVSLGFFSRSRTPMEALVRIANKAVGRRRYKVSDELTQESQFSEFGWDCARQVIVM